MSELDAYDFALPEALIALRPAEPRGSARLLVAGSDWHRDVHVADFRDWFRAGDLLVINDTKVIPARLFGHRLRGVASARVEITLLEPRGTPGEWLALAKPLRKLAESDRLEFGALSATVGPREGDAVLIRFDASGPALDAALEREGQMPLPPYIESRRAADAQDRRDYQPLWADKPGAVAAPTASLHFDAALIATLKAKGVRFASVTLHVGAGTFLPVKVDTLADHKMHAEWGRVSEETARLINETRAAGGRVIPVGTTALRIIESAAGPDGVQAFEGKTDIFIYPGYRFRAADALVTNFHLPKSTLLMLVAALIGHKRVLDLYAHAVATGYRFFSYGDASLLLPGEADPGGNALTGP
jgi:S-adenosylmethionine:tRNA ribosyltransferase-isomerase